MAGKRKRNIKPASDASRKQPAPVEPESTIGELAATAGEGSISTDSASELAQLPAPSADLPAGQRSPGCPIVGIGASAGGLDAFKRFFSKMPADSGVAFVLVPHLDPTHESLMVELLARQTKMPVCEAQDAMPIEPNHVYVIPPNKYLAVVERKLRLSAPTERHASPTAIDFFFRSLAAEARERAIGIILSGTSSHGTLGLKEIKLVGGTVMVQQPESAEYDQMPRSAIATGLVDFVLPPEEMPEALVKFVRHPFVQSPLEPTAEEASREQLHRDISDRKRLEASLLQLNATLEQRVADQTREIKLLAEAISHLGEGVVITDDELDWPGPRIRFVNDAICRITGYAADELIGKTPRILQGKGTSREALGHTKLELSAGRSCLVEVVNYRKDGTSYDAELFITPLFDDEGRRTNFVSIHRDITVRKQAEDALRRSEEQLRAILNTATDAIISIDQRGIITAVNPATQRMFGYTRDDLLGQNVRLLMPPPYRDEHDAYLARFLQTREARIIGIGREVVGQRKDGSIFAVDLAVSEVDHLGLFTGIIRDISLRKMLQKQVLEISVAEQRRIGQELHDGTGQELTGLALFAGTLVELLSKTPQRAPGDQGVWLLPEADLQRLRQTAKKLSEKLVETNRHVQQLSRGIMPVQIEAEGLRSALEELAAATDELPNITCRCQCSQAIAVANNTTATHLYRIAQEAVNNAMRHSRADEIRISLAQAKDDIILEVSDNGTGFDLATARQASGSSSTHGFGLGIMDYRAGMIGGTLRVLRLDEGGTLVRCTASRGG